MSLAEHKRYYTFNVSFNALGAVGNNDALQDTYIYNPFAALVNGVGDFDVVGDEILDPFLVQRGSIDINWAAFTAGSFSGILPTVQLEMYVIAVNDQLTNNSGPVLTSFAQDLMLFMKQPSTVTGGGAQMTTQLNSHNVTVVRKKKMKFMPHNLAVGAGATPAYSRDTHNWKMTCKLRGKKQFETTVSTIGSYNRTGYFKGWNYYFLSVLTTNGTTGATGTFAGNPIRVICDHYVYFKDF